MVRLYTEGDVERMAEIWNQVVESGDAFPQTDLLDAETASAFFASQRATAVAEDEAGRVVGLYILHPNNIGRVGHIANASFAVDKAARGRGVGEALVRHCLAKARTLGFRILQFNAVVASNTRALELYRKLGFTDLGVIPGGFFNARGVYEDIHVMYAALTKA